MAASSLPPSLYNAATHPTNPVAFAATRLPSDARYDEGRPPDASAHLVGPAPNSFQRRQWRRCTSRVRARVGWASPLAASRSSAKHAVNCFSGTTCAARRHQSVRGRNRRYPTTTGRKRAEREPHAGWDMIPGGIPCGRVFHPAPPARGSIPTTPAQSAAGWSVQCADGASRPVNLQGLLDVGVRVAQLAPFESLVRKHCVKLHLIRNRSSHRTRITRALQLAMQRRSFALSDMSAVLSPIASRILFRYRTRSRTRCCSSSNERPQAARYNGESKTRTCFPRNAATILDGGSCNALSAEGCCVCKAPWVSNGSSSCASPYASSAIAGHDLYELCASPRSLDRASNSRSNPTRRGPKITPVRKAALRQRPSCAREQRPRPPAPLPTHSVS